MSVSRYRWSTLRHGDPELAMDHWLCSVGTLIEWYDCYWYGGVAPSFSQHFFSLDLNATVAFIGSLLAGLVPAAGASVAAVTGIPAERTNLSDGNRRYRGQRQSRFPVRAEQQDRIWDEVGGPRTVARTESGYRF